MFTGIIESLGKIEKININGANKTFAISSALHSELKIDQSLSHNGVCLTVENLEVNTYNVTAVAETLSKTNMGNLEVGDLINLERCMLFNGRLDGHIVQGHVDSTAVCSNVIEMDGSWQFNFTFNDAFAPLIIEKGSICINGISLTAFNVTKNSFSVAIIPFTFNHTNICFLNPGDEVNIEFDILGKYLLRMKQLE